MSNARTALRPVLLLGALMPAACAGTTVSRQGALSMAGPITAPHHVAVLVFDRSPLPKRAGRQEAHAQDVRQMNARLTEALGKALASHGLVVVPTGTPADAPLLSGSTVCDAAAPSPAC